MIRSTDPRRLAPALWILLGLFILRVVGQALVAFLDVRWLPPMEQWYSGLAPYPLLLPAQVVIILIYGKVCVDFSRGAGWFVRTRPWFGHGVLWLGYLYLGVMIARYPVQIALSPEARWFDRTIPIVFHWVLATFIILFGRFHRARLPISHHPHTMAAKTRKAR